MDVFWGIQSWVSGSFPLTPALDVQDYVYDQTRLVWQEKWNTFLGTDLVILTNPAPTCRGILDDEVFVTGFVSDISPPAPVAVFVAGGRRKSEHLLRKAREFQLQLTYRIWPNFIDPGAFWNTDTVLVKSSIEHLPVLLKAQAREAQFAAALGHGWLDGLKTRPYLIPAGRYGDEKCRVLEEIQRHFLEPVIDEGQTWDLWTYEEVHKALEMRTYRFLLETGIARKEVLVGMPFGQVEAEMPQDAIEIRRVDWEYDDLRQKPRVLQRIDTLQADYGQPQWDETPGEPVAYIKDPGMADNSMALRLFPQQDADGTLRIRYVPMPTLRPEVLCEPLPIPRMFTWALKWGVIADLLKKEGEANDPVRAAQAEKMYELGVDLARFLVGAKS